jgi:P4 family phage/plasmid primase-like protien
MITKTQNIPNIVMETIQNNANIKLFHYSGKFFLYEDNYYKDIDESIKHKIFRLINPQEITSNMVNEVIALLRINPAFLLDETQYDIEPARYINFNNGILDLYKRELIPHTPDIIFFSKIPYNYNPNAEIDDITEKLINNFVKSDNADESDRKRKMIFEYTGVIISNIRGLKNFIFILGLKDTGKSTYCGLIMRLIGNGNYSSLPLDDLTEKSFYLNEIVGKKANIITETDDTPLKDITTLKKLTGGLDEKISCHIKYVQNPQQITPRAMLIFAGNTIPPLWNNGDKKAFIERMIPIKFESPVEESDKIKDILDKINMEYIIKESIERLYAFVDNNYVFTQPAQSATMRNEILKAEDIIRVFVDDCDLSDKEHKIYTASLYKIFEAWADRNGYSTKEISSNIFTRRLKNIIGDDKHKKVSINGGNSLWGFTGIIPPTAESIGCWGTMYDGNQVAKLCCFDIFLMNGCYFRKRKLT